MIFFSNSIKALNIPRTNHSDSVIKNVRNPALKDIVRYHNHPSILVIKEKIKSGSVFTFN